MQPIRNNYQQRLKQIKNSGGFTLLELIIVIVLLGGLSVGISSFIGIATQSFVNTAERDEIIASARFSVERLNREVRNALPNSARVLNFPSGETCLEFVPIMGASIYKNLDVSRSFDQITTVAFVDDEEQPYTCNSSCGDSVVIYPLGYLGYIDNSDVYVDPEQSAGQLFAIESIDKPAGDFWQINLENTVTLGRASPNDRLYVVNQPVRYCEDNNTLNRVSNYNLSDQLTSSVYPTNSTAVAMAENVDANFAISEATLTRNSVVQMRLTFFRANDTAEEIVFDHEVHIANTP